MLRKYEKQKDSGFHLTPGLGLLPAFKQQHIFWAKGIKPGPEMVLEGVPSP